MSFTIQSLELKNVSYSYHPQTQVLQNLDGRLPQAKAVWVRSSGRRGKSTFLRLLAGLLTPTSGRYLINDQNIAEMSFEQFLPYRLKIGYSFDLGGLLNNKSLGENLLLPLAYHKICSPEEAVSRVENLRQRFGFENMLDARPFAVPSSMRKLTCIARSLIHHPEIAFLDEPLAGLKTDQIDSFIAFIRGSFAATGLNQIYFTSESPVLAEEFDAEELFIGPTGLDAKVMAA